MTRRDAFIFVTGCVAGCVAGGALGYAELAAEFNATYKKLNTAIALHAENTRVLQKGLDSLARERDCALQETAYTLRNDSCKIDNDPDTRELTNCLEKSRMTADEGSCPPQSGKPAVPQFP